MKNILYGSGMKQSMRLDVILTLPNKGYMNQVVLISVLLWHWKNISYQCFSGNGRTKQKHLMSCMRINIGFIIN